MDGQRLSSSSTRRRQRKRSRAAKIPPAPILIAARRPDAPPARPSRKLIAASASPKLDVFGDVPSTSADVATSATEAASSRELMPRRNARIVTTGTAQLDEREHLRARLIERLLVSEGRAAITRAADAVLEAGFEFPNNQGILLQLLEHFDERQALRTLELLRCLLASEPPIKRPVFEQRLRRLEELAEDPSLRQSAGELRRTLRG